MNRRTMLRGQLRRAWREVIETDYARQRINSERSLQAALWARLDALLPPQTRRLFIEPTVSLDGDSKRRAPDLVICNTRSVIGIVEIKYLPRAAPKWQKELETFRWILAHHHRLAVTNYRFRGVEVDSRAYPVAGDPLFAWAGVHARSGVRLADYLEEGPGFNFLELHAETVHGRQPRLR